MAGIRRLPADSGGAQHERYGLTGFEQLFDREGEDEDGGEEKKGKP